MLWACIHLPELALDSVRRCRPPDAAPLVLVTGPANRRVLHAVDATAAAHGLRVGQSLAAAQAVLNAFEALPFDQQDSARQLALLAAWAYGYSGQVSTNFADAVLLEVGGSLGLFGPWPRFEVRLRDDLRALGFQHRIALAPTPRAAWVLAMARDGMAITQDVPLRTALAQLPIARAGIAAAQVALLQGMGLRRLGQMLALPRDALAKRFGPALLQHCDRLCGREPEPLVWYRPPEVFDARIELSYEVELAPALIFPLRRLVFDLAAFLAGRDGGVQRFQLRLEHEGRADTVITVGLLAAERDPALLFELARSRLERSAVPAPVRGVRVLAEELPAFVPAARELFDQRPAQSLPWPSLRERLRARLGSEAVYSLRVGDDHRPERAYAKAGEGAEALPLASPPPRPTWLLARPIPLRDHALRCLAGPERLETGWWDGDDVRRDYYLVETSSGQRAWAFCAAGERGPFMLHGWFA